MTFYIGNTDYNWFSFLRNQEPEDVNFWQPGGKANFKVLSSGGPFLMKLKSPHNAIAGVGFFSSHSKLPLSIAWDAFGIRNGCGSLEEFRGMISKYRTEFWDQNPQIGCIVLTNPIFFADEDWLPVPTNWANSIVQGKSYSTTENMGRTIWNQIEEKLQKYLPDSDTLAKSTQLIIENQQEEQYNKFVLAKVRLGQGAFRVLVTDAYLRKCSISGEKTLPVLEAAHIKPYAESGPHSISNGLLLRSDIHKLFDSGYITLTDNYIIEVSKRIKEEYSNGREYYKFHGQQAQNLPPKDFNRPGKNFIRWHNENIYRE